MAHKTFRGAGQQVRFGGYTARSNAGLATQCDSPSKDLSSSTVKTLCQLGPRSLGLDALKLHHTAPKARPLPSQPSRKWNPQSSCLFLALFHIKGSLMPISEPRSHSFLMVVFDEVWGGEEEEEGKKNAFTLPILIVIFQFG